MLFARTRKAAEESEFTVVEAQNHVENETRLLTSALTNQMRNIGDSIGRLQEALVSDVRQALRWGAVLFVATQIFQLLVIAALFVLLA